MLFYLSGPMTGLPDFNYPAFNENAAWLRAKGLQVINPAENFGGNEELPREEYMRRDVEDLLRADAIILMDDWYKSAGSRLELEIAKQIGLEVWRLDREGDRCIELDPNEVPPHHEAETIVNGARQADYGHPLDDFSKTAQIWSAILGIDITPEEVALCMVGVKISREVNKPKRDNIVDAHGYLMTYAMVQDEIERRSKL